MSVLFITLFVLTVYQPTFAFEQPEVAVNIKLSDEAVYADGRTCTQKPPENAKRKKEATSLLAEYKKV